MNRELTARCIWLVDTISRYGRITRQQLDQCWSKSRFGDGSGHGLPRRTFCRYREAAEELFDIVIECDPSTYEYFIDDSGAPRTAVSKWLLDSAVTNEVLSQSRDVSERIFVEPVPSAREHLAPAIEALRQNRSITFDYQAFNRDTPTLGVVLEPYFMKLFRQRWYITGRNVADGRIKTYALDRMACLRLNTSVFEPDPAFDPCEYFRHSFGIVAGEGEPLDIEIRTGPVQAKYLRALPLHHSQSEQVHAGYSIFSYRMRITPDLVEELLSHGPSIEVLSPPELRRGIADALRTALRQYED
ncbi:MAG: WYL domain-containing protein [Muribaculaceae bacterium]|nr:WYL domain-containing protein [Muribaculaceae bacterium]